MLFNCITYALAISNFACLPQACQAVVGASTGTFLDSSTWFVSKHIIQSIWLVLSIIVSAPLKSSLSFPLPGSLGEIKWKVDFFTMSIVRYDVSTCQQLQISHTERSRAPA